MDQNNENLRFKYRMLTLFPMILLLLVQLGASSFVQGIAMGVRIRSFSGESYVDFIEEITDIATSSAVMGATYIVYSVIAGFIMFYLYRKNISEDRRLIIKKPIKNMTNNPVLFLAGILLLTVGLQFAVSHLSTALAVMHPEWLYMYEYILKTSGIDQGMSAALWIYTAVLGPVVEELTFRGVTMEYMYKSQRSDWFMIVFSALLFALVHGNPLQGITAFIVGLVLSYLMFKYDNILVPIIVHIIFNSIAFVPKMVLGENNNPMVFGMGFFVSLIVSYAGLLLLIKAAKNSDKVLLKGKH